MHAGESTEEQAPGSQRVVVVPGSTLDRMLRHGYFFDFFQAVWLLEKFLRGGKTPGEGSDPAEERINIRPHSGLVFPSTDVRKIELIDEDPQRARVTVTFGGLYGIDSPLPVYFYDSIATEAEPTRPLRDFLDIFNSRLYSLFYRTWKKRRPALEFQTPGTDKASQRFLCLAGVGTKKALAQARVPFMRLAAHAGRLSCRVRNSEGLRDFLQAFFKEVRVRIQENVPRWVPIANRARMAKGGVNRPVLGSTATIGEKIRDVSGKFRVVLGPLTLSQYTSFLPGADGAAILSSLVEVYAPDSLAYDVELLLRRDEIPPARLGDRTVKVGLTAWAGRTTKPYAFRIVSYDGAAHKD
jgi:type VI secretion system protein ImpH